jgi:hypothetical protein
MALLTDRWCEIMGTDAGEALAELTMAYSGISRPYQNLAHIEAMLALSADPSSPGMPRDRYSMPRPASASGTGGRLPNRLEPGITNL